MKTIILGTRGSELALTQTRMTTSALHAALLPIFIKHEVIRTSGDMRPDLPLMDFSKGDQPVVDKGIFTKELEQALKAGTIHAAVHSLKDVPTVLEEGFRIVATLPRGPIEDVLISKSPGGLNGLPQGATVATSSVRRRRQLLELRPDLVVVEIRGNVPTRIRKVGEDETIHALILARAGLDRLSIYAEAADYGGVMMYMNSIPADVMLPAASQGAVGLEIYGENPELETVLAAINNGPTFTRVTAERRFLELLEAGCQTPVGVYTSLEGDVLRMKAVVFPDNGGTQRAEVTGPAAAPAQVAESLFAALA